MMRDFPGGRVFSGGLLSLVVIALAACQAQPTVNVSAPTPEMARVQQAMAAWPSAPSDGPAINRTFFATIHIAGHRTTASGVLQFHNARDFRITAATEMGVILFDGRMNWAGVTVLRSMPGISSAIIGSLLKDIASSFQLPETLNGVQVKGRGTGTQLVLKRQLADTNHYTWIFDASSGRLQEIDEDLGLFDTLRINYLRYNERGWPEEMTVTRKALFYTISFTFTDGAGGVAKR
jgi:hypothetical protein